MLEQLKSLPEDALRKAIQKRLKVYENAERMLDSFNDLMHNTVLASSDEEMFDDLEEVLAADQEATAAGRNVIDVSGGGEFERGGFADHVITLPKFNAPDRDKLITNHGYLKKAREYQEELDYMITRLKDSTDRDDKALLKTLTQHRKLMTEKKNKAQDTLSSLAERHVPRELARAADVMEDHVITLMGTSDNLGAQWFITQDADNLDFCFYMHVPIKDHSESHLDVYLVLTGRVVEGPKGYLMRVFLTSMNQMKLPGQFDVGSRISFTSQQTMNNAMKREVSRLLAKQGLVSALGKNKLNTTTRQLRDAGITKLPNVIDLRVQNDAIYLLLSNVADRDIERQTVPELILLLKNTLHKQKKDAVFMRNLSTTRSGKKMMKIISVNEV